MKYEEIISSTKNTMTEDGYKLEKEFEFWRSFNYEKTRWKSTQVAIPILCNFMHIEKEVTLNGSYTQKILSPNKDIPFPNADQKNAIEYLFENETHLGKILIDYIFIKYNELREYYKEEDDSIDMPKLNNSFELRDLIELTQVYILSNSNSGISFIGFCFACAWDDEHGMGLLTHKDKIVQFGQIEEATDEYFKM